MLEVTAGGRDAAIASLEAFATHFVRRLHRRDGDTLPTPPSLRLAGRPRSTARGHHSHDVTVTPGRAFERLGLDADRHPTERPTPRV